MPDRTSPSTDVTLRLSSNSAATLDRLAVLLGRPRSWIMERALRHYLKTEGAALIEDAEAIAELDRGDSAPAQQMLAEVDEIIKRRKPSVRAKTPPHPNPLRPKGAARE
ncbi:MAG: CopG family ribbon-helix-helix protein [Stellaceae bacterium]